jgi:hypothetical protein
LPTRTKLFERIDSNFDTESFVLNTSATINLATCTTPNGLPCQSLALRPDNAPICPVIDSTSSLTFVTLRGGGLFVVDARTTPMSIIAEYDISTVRPNGCLGVEASGKMYIDSGGGTASHKEGADLYAFPLTGYSALNPPNTPAPRVIFSRDEGDSHGATIDRSGRYLWVADRFFNFIDVVDTLTDAVVNRISLLGPLSSDPTPDLLVTSPNGSHIFASLRGPTPLTADPHVSTGSTPGVGAIKVTQNGRGGFFQGLVRVSNIDAGGVERADVHALTLRSK